MQEYGPEADEWSVGMLMYQLLTGNLPFWDSVKNVSLQQASLLTACSDKFSVYAIYALQGSGGPYMTLIASGMTC